MAMLGVPLPGLPSTSMRHGHLTADLIHVVLGDIDASSHDAQVRYLEQFGAFGDVRSQVIGREE